MSGCVRAFSRTFTIFPWDQEANEDFFINELLELNFSQLHHLKATYFEATSFNLRNIYVSSSELRKHGHPFFTLEYINIHFPSYFAITTQCWIELLSSWERILCWSDSEISQKHQEYLENDAAMYP